MPSESFRIKSRGSPSDTQRIFRTSFTSLVALNASAIFFSVVRLNWNGDICIFKWDRAASAEFGDIGSASARHQQPMCTSQQNKNKHLKKKRVTIKIEAYSKLLYSNLYTSKIAINCMVVLLFWIRSISIWNAY